MSKKGSALLPSSTGVFCACRELGLRTGAFWCNFRRKAKVEVPSGGLESRNRPHSISVVTYCSDYRQDEVSCQQTTGGAVVLVSVFLLILLTLLLLSKPTHCQRFILSDLLDKNRGHRCLAFPSVHYIHTRLHCSCAYTWYLLSGSAFPPLVDFHRLLLTDVFALPFREPIFRTRKKSLSRTSIYS